MKTTHKVGHLNGVPILIVTIEKDKTDMTRPLTETELQLICDQLNEEVK